ncbi:MAG: response regulator [Planctomycetaceae bacterium]
MTRVLIVDDSATDRRLAGGLLERKGGFELLFAEHGRAALEQLELHLPDLVLTDLQMPEMDGLELVQAIKRDYPLIPVILMTAKGSEDIAVRALQHGAASYVPKRQLSTDLDEIVERVLSAASEIRGHSRLMSRMSESVHRFMLENDVTLVHSVVHYLQDAMARLRLCTEAEKLRVGVALEEALVNAYYHGNLEVSSTLREDDHQAYYDLARQRAQEEPYRTRSIHVEARLTQSEAVYVIRDEGPGFDPGSLPDPCDPENLERPCGRGLLLMRTFMDEVHYNERGNEVTLIKRKPPRDESGEGEDDAPRNSADDAL